MKIEKLLLLAEEYGWNVEEDNSFYILSQYSPEGQDFIVQFEAEDPYSFISELKRRHDNFDVSEETYMWLDNNGHGANGAPYDMRDVYEDMEYCKKLILELYNALDNFMKVRGK